MLKRTITAIVAVAVMAPVLIFSDTVIFSVGVGVCLSLAVYELIRCVGYEREISLWILYPISFASPFLLRYGCADADTALKLLLAYPAVYLLFLLAVAVLGHKRFSFQNISALFVGLTYALIGFNAIEYIRDYEPGGKYLYLIVFIAAWMTDIFAYFVGVFFGKHRLIPELSPKKTVEGSIGGIVFCTAFVTLFGILIGHYHTQMEANWPLFLLAGIFLSIVSQIGDLSMSALKRIYGVKDFGKIFPGHGGILDRFDSVLAVSITLFLFATFFNFFEVL